LYSIKVEHVIRPCGATEAELLKKFLDENFGYTQPQSYSIDFAPLFESDSLARSKIIWSEGKIVSSAILHPATALTPTGNIKLGIVGAVATAEHCRGQGFSKKVFQEIEAEAKAMQLEGLILWSDQNEFYTKMGFTPVGKQEIWELTPLAQVQHQYEGRVVASWTTNEVRKLYEAHPRRMVRDDAYWRATQRIESCTRIQWIGKDDQVEAYLGFNRGRDMQNIVHEWGGKPPALLALIKAALKEQPQLFWLTHPKLPDPARYVLATQFKPLSEGPLALFKPLKTWISPQLLDDLWVWGLDSL